MKKPNEKKTKKNILKKNGEKTKSTEKEWEQINPTENQGKKTYWKKGEKTKLLKKGKKTLVKKKKNLQHSEKTSEQKGNLVKKE